MSYDVLAPEDARLWPYQPDWSRGVDVRRSFSTDIITTRNATEQRRALRTNPRLAMEYRTVVSGDDRRGADLHMRVAQNQPVAVPDWVRHALTTASSGVGTSTLTISPMPVWVAAGQPLILCSASGLEMVLVASVVSTTVNLVDPLAATWPSGSVVRPTFFGLFNGRTVSSRLNKDVAAIDIEVSSYPGGEPPRSAGSAWASLGGYEVFTLQPDYSGPPSLAYAWPVEQVDYDRGRTAQFRPVERSGREIEAEFRGQETPEEIEQFFDRMKGRRGAFYMPTWEKDFVLAETAGSGTATFLAEGPDLATELSGGTFDATTAIAVCMTNGTHIYRLVTGIAAETGDSRVTVSANWGVDLTVATVARISWMPLWRFLSDEMVTSWVTPLRANVRLGMKTVLPAPEVAAS